MHPTKLNITYITFIVFVVFIVRFIERSKNWVGLLCNETECRFALNNNRCNFYTKCFIKSKSICLNLNNIEFNLINQLLPKFSEDCCKIIFNFLLSLKKIKKQYFPKFLYITELK